MEINENLNDQIIEVEKWLKCNRLKLNVNKTKVMLIRGKKKKVLENNIKIKLENKILEIVDEK